MQLLEIVPMAWSTGKTRHKKLDISHYSRYVGLRSFVCTCIVCARIGEGCPLYANEVTL